MSLTIKQRDLLLFIQRYQDAHGGVAPKYDEMRDALGLASKSSVHRLIANLEDRGFIRRIPGRARAVEIVRRVRDPIAPAISCDGRDLLRAFVLEVAYAPVLDAWGWRRKALQLAGQT